MFQLTANNQQLFVAERELLVSGSSKVYTCAFSFTQEWDGLAKTAVFQGAGEAVKAPLIGEDMVCQIPWEALERPCRRCRAGVFGITADGVRLPTVWADLGPIYPGAADGNPGQEPTPTEYEQLLCAIGTLEDLPTEDKSSLVNAILEMYGNTGIALEKIASDIADLQYSPIEIASFGINGSAVAAMGSTVNDVTLIWSISKTPTALTLDGTAIDVGLTATQLKNQGITAAKTWTLVATDERGATAQKAATLSFQNYVYYGAGAAGPATKALSSTRKRTFTVTAGDGEYIWYQVPVRLGECAFKVGGFEGGFDLVSTEEITNTAGYSEAYRIYRSANTGLGSTTVEVS